MRPVLVLRPEPGASTTADRVRALGLQAVVSPLFAVEPLPWHAPDPDEFDALLLTSANAVRHGGEQLQRLSALPVYAVGEATAQAARQVGFDIAAVGEAGIDRLLEVIPANLKLLHCCGEDRRGSAKPRQRITSLPVYRAKAIGHPDLRAAAGSVALIHSPRAGRRFAELVRDRSSIAIAAISRAAADAVGPAWQEVGTAEIPSDDALLALAARLCEKPALG